MIKSNDRANHPSTFFEGQIDQMKKRDSSDVSLVESEKSEKYSN